MAKTSENGLELDDDPSFQERFWSLQRIAWIVLALIVIGALTGFTGQGGMFADAKITGATGTIEYPRVTRWEASDELRLTLTPGSGNEAAVEIGTSFSEIFGVEDIQPAPSDSYATGAGQRLVFDLGEPRGTREIVMHVRAMKPSLGSAIEVRIGDGPVLSFTPVVLP